METGEKTGEGVGSVPRWREEGPECMESGQERDSAANMIASPTRTKKVTRQSSWVQKQKGEILSPHHT